MNTIRYITIPINGDANLRLRRDRIIATVNVPGSDHVDIYTSGVSNPWHVSNVNSDDIIAMIWDEEEDY